MFDEAVDKEGSGMQGITNVDQDLVSSKRKVQGLVRQRRYNLIRLGSILVLGLGRQENRVDVGDHTASSDGDILEQLVELLVVADGQLDVAGDDAHPLVVAGSVASELENLGSEVLEDGGEVHGGTSTDTSGVAALTELPVDASDGELQSSAGRASLRSSLLSLSLGDHFDVVDSKLEMYECPTAAQWPTDNSNPWVPSHNPCFYTHPSL